MAQQADIGETTDLVDERPDVTTRLAGELIRWLDELDARLATLREGKAPVDLTVRGTTYADGMVTQYERSTTVTVEPGDEPAGDAAALGTNSRKPAHDRPRRGPRRRRSPHFGP